MPARRACQVVLALSALLPMSAVAGEAVDEVRAAVRMLRRLERTCLEYDGPNRHRLLDAVAREAVRLYEGANYDPALDAVLLTWALYPEDLPRAYHGLQPGRVEVAVRWPSKDEAGLLPLDAKKYTWVMVAVTNKSEEGLRLRGLRATVGHKGAPLRDASGAAVESIAPEDRALRKLLGQKAAALWPPRVAPGKTATFPMVFPAFDRWTEIRFVHEPSRIYAPVWDYAAVERHVARRLRAERVVAAQRAKIAAAKAKAAEPGPEKEPPARPRYVLIGYVRNEVSAGKFGIQLVEPKLAREHTVYFVRAGRATTATLKPIGSGSIAELAGRGGAAKKGDAVYVLVEPPAKKSGPDDKRKE